jgi:hypothetical protein
MVRGVVASILLFKSLIDSAVQVDLCTTYLFVVSSKVHKEESQFENMKNENSQRKGHPEAQGGVKQEELPSQVSKECGTSKKGIHRQGSRSGEPHI